MGKTRKIIQTRIRNCRTKEYEYAPWDIVPADDKKRARLNCISHFLSLIPYEDLPKEKVKLGERNMKDKYDDRLSPEERHFIPQKY